MSAQYLDGVLAHPLGVAVPIMLLVAWQLSACVGHHLCV